MSCGFASEINIFSIQVTFVLVGDQEIYKARVVCHDGVRHYITAI
jgi:hypothetical protein